MESIDAKVFAIIAGLTLVGVESLKAFFPKGIKGKETKVAAILPILFVVIAKAAGGFPSTPWVDALLWAVGGGAASGVGHDKVWDPIKSLVIGIFKKPAKADTSSAPGSGEQK